MTILKANSCSMGRKAAKYRPARRLCSRFPLSPTSCQPIRALISGFSRHGISLSTRGSVPRIIGTPGRKNARACLAATIVFSFIHLHMCSWKANLEFSGSQPVQHADTGSPISAIKSREYLYITNQPDRSRCDETSKRRVKLFPCTKSHLDTSDHGIFPRHFFTPQADRDVRNRTDVVLFVNAILL